MLQPGEDDLTERKRLHIRCAALMPRIILPLNPHPTDACSTRRSYAGPDALVVQADELLIQLMVPPITTRASAVLSGLLARQLPDYCPSDPRLAREKHVPVDMTKFATLVRSTERNTGYFTGDSVS
ncbi:hypothetical protein P879_11558 [Paragonimus westermani]|uniref:Uncharacterized protein n=1 Tax=Paragonimus westermani TaxID=34504 RepID=A0A8T0D6U8_9TREM|nr:hypothetical protein P879_11558 [Paragonimus westermani]